MNTVEDVDVLREELILQVSRRERIGTDYEG